MLRVYLGGNFNLREKEIQEKVAPMFRQAGFDVVSTWHDSQERKLRQGWAAQAEQDLHDLSMADVLIVKMEPDGVYVSGGLHFEMGYAFAKGIPIIMVGERLNVFHALVIQVDSWLDALIGMANY